MCLGCSLVPPSFISFNIRKCSTYHFLRMRVYLKQCYISLSQEKRKSFTATNKKKLWPMESIPFPLFLWWFGFWRIAISIFPCGISSSWIICPMYHSVWPCSYDYVGVGVLANLLCFPICCPCLFKIIKFWQVKIYWRIFYLYFVYLLMCLFFSVLGRTCSSRRARSWVSWNIWPSKLLQYYLVESLLENCDSEHVMYPQKSYIYVKWVV
jgi:hypothetical protein